jgi:surfeit locus 1 family protein
VLDVLRNWRFLAAAAGLVLAAAGMAVCAWLGMWQLDRAEEKRALIASFDAGSAPVPVTEGVSLDALPRYQSIELSGSYDPQHQILLDNMPSSRGQPGYHVLTTLQRDNGEWLLIDRGWVPGGRTREQLPDVHVAGGPRTLQGRLDELPQPGIRLGSASATVHGNWPRVLHFPLHEELQAVLGRKLARRILLLDPAQPDGYERLWRARFRVSPERHLAYAIQWFALLAAILVTVVVVNFRKHSAHVG